MTHGLAVRRGRITILCNGRPNVNGSGDVKNIYTGNLDLLRDALSKTEESAKKGTSTKYQTRVMLPQSMLKDRVTCSKCRAFMDPKTKESWMSRIRGFATSDMAETLRKYKTGRMTVLGKRPVGRPRKKDAVQLVAEEPQQRVDTSIPGTLHVPTGKTLVLTFAVV